ncbi:MAG: DUF4445 domain-containing protein [Clostridia bacterium]|nr:DUF4445 domain-containing protein [Clostridia bacterium]
MHKVIINGVPQFVADGTLLSEALIKSGNGIDHPCGGKGICRKCLVSVNGKEELSCRYKIKSDIVVSLSENSEILSVTGAIETGVITEKLCFALDIGTTTLALALVSLDENKIIKVLTRTNPQRAYGADVMTRIDYCRKNGADALNKAVIAEINSMISAFGLHKIEKLCVSGNATMLHLFFGIDCSSMGVAPYTPVFLEGRIANAKELGLAGVEYVEALPSISAFVGADIVAGMNYIGMPANGRYNLLIDLGTNAEIVLFDEKSALCTAAAAGPCFEGANVSCGMSATDGAVCSYTESGIKTVGDLPAKGICGTGLVDIIAELLFDEIIDETGFMECEQFDIADGVYLNQADIRQYQLAKSAVYSAIITLLEIRNISFDDIEKMYISGGFSAKIKIGNAVKTGLLPKELASKCVPINNSSLLGTFEYACSRNDLSVYTDNADYVDLSGNSAFADLFIENMMFEV